MYKERYHTKMLGELCLLKKKMAQKPTIVSYSSDVQEMPSELVNNYLVPVNGQQIYDTPASLSAHSARLLQCEIQAVLFWQ